MRTHTLDPRFESFYSANVCRGVEDPNRRGHYIDGERLYRVEGVYRFFGNFFNVSYVFTIDTNHRPTIDLLTRLIDANVQTEAYQKAADEIDRAKREQEQRDRERWEKARRRRLDEALAIVAQGMEPEDERERRTR